MVPAASCCPSCTWSGLCGIMAAVCPSHDDPLRHLQRPVALPLLLPALHAHQGRQVLHHRRLPDPGRALRDERRCHLHSAAHGLAPSLGKHLLRLCLHPGVAGPPPGPGQRHRLRHPAEARVTPRDLAPCDGPWRWPHRRQTRGRIGEKTETRINQKNKTKHKKNPKKQNKQTKKRNKPSHPNQTQPTPRGNTQRVPC
uniref:Peripheral myelin protein 22 n=1 Tax=Ficedula albicollis TaxID=59894 RepID=U3K4I0_FICAL